MNISIQQLTRLEKALHHRTPSGNLDEVEKHVKGVIKSVLGEFRCRMPTEATLDSLMMHVVGPVCEIDRETRLSRLVRFIERRINEGSLDRAVG